MICGTLKWLGRVAAYFYDRFWFKPYDMDRKLGVLFFESFEFTFYITSKSKKRLSLQKKLPPDSIYVWQILLSDFVISDGNLIMVLFSALHMIYSSYYTL